MRRQEALGLAYSWGGLMDQGDSMAVRFLSKDLNFNKEEVIKTLIC